MRCSHPRQTVHPAPFCQVQQVQGTGNAGQENILWEVPTKELV